MTTRHHSARAAAATLGLLVALGVAGPWCLTVAVAGSPSAIGQGSTARGGALGPLLPSERDALDSMMTDAEQLEAGADRLSPSERVALARAILQAYASGREQQFEVSSSYGTFSAGLIEFTGSRFVFDVNATEIERLRRSQPNLEWTPGKIELYPYQVTWLRR